MVGPFDPDHDRDAEFFAAGPALPIEHVLLEQQKNDSIAALSHAATRPIDPTSPWFLRAITNALDRN